MGKRYTMKVYPAGMSRTVYRVLQISGKETLDRLCSVIISSFDFIDEHLYEFCMDQGYADRNLIAKWKKVGPKSNLIYFTSVAMALQCA